MSESETKKLLEKIRTALFEIGKQIRLDHKLKGQPIVVSDGKGGVKFIPPEDIKI